MSTSSSLRITFRFLQLESHGRGEDGRPEWPPSPLRMFQALVAASSVAGWSRDALQRSGRSSGSRAGQRRPSSLAVTDRWPAIARMCPTMSATRLLGRGVGATTRTSPSTEPKRTSTP
ncbi:MAG: type I-U CRISPR-associated protein Cas5/Cas6 [Myxococcales bacterium]|nr:type I-U CRISPR-associated protein Cas5/Cas6 [Myxococcales bacterium]